MRTRSEYAILAVALIGILLSVYAITLHYSPSSSSFCNISANVNCDKVNKSPWAVIFAIPVAILGLLAYLAVFLITLKRRAIKRWLAFSDKDYAEYFVLLAMVMFLFQLYLTFAEAFFIHAYCIVCLASQVCTIALAYLGWREYLEERRLHRAAHGIH
jgi:uncharacterized membrane protein